MSLSSGNEILLNKPTTVTSNMINNFYCKADQQNQHEIVSHMNTELTCLQIEILDVQKGLYTICQCHYLRHK